MATAHINAKDGDFAKTVLMPGDPLRSQFIAENFLNGIRLVNNVRGIQGYTGLYKGKEVSVMASGMGMPSMGIYSYELFNFFSVENIIRVGSAGAYSPKAKIKDIVIGMGACTDSSYAHQYGLPGAFAPIADFGILEKCVAKARKLQLDFHVGNLISSDTFYNEPDSRYLERWGKMGVLAVEMEAAALYMNAARAGKKALAICTVSDQLVFDEHLTAQERQSSFNDMITLALETAVEL